MKNIYTRFLAIVVIIVMTFGCTMVAHADEDNQYELHFDTVTNSGIIIPAETAIMLEPSAESEQIGTLKSGTACLIKGSSFNPNDKIVWYIIDITGLNLNGNETEYGYINSYDVVMNPEWLILPEPIMTDSTPWMNDTHNGMVSGRVMVIGIDYGFYAIHTMDSLTGTSFINTYSVDGYSSGIQNPWVVPISTPVYEDSKKEQVGEIPAFTIVDVKERDNDTIHVTVNPGTSEEFSGWIPWQPLQVVIN